MVGIHIYVACIGSFAAYKGPGWKLFFIFVYLSNSPTLLFYINFYQFIYVLRLSSIKELLQKLSKEYGMNKICL